MGAAMDWELDPNGIGYLFETRRRRRAGLPAVMPDDPGRPVTAAMLANREVALDLLEHPLVLTYFSVHDPTPSLAVAAASRLMPRAAGTAVGRDMAGWIARTAPHERVRDGVGEVVQRRFAPSAMEALDWLAQRSIDDDAEDGRREMVALLKRLTRPGPPPAHLVGRLVTLAMRIGMRRATLDHLMLSLVEGRHVAPEAKAALIDGMDLLPRDLRYRIMARVCALPEDMRTAPMKQALAAHLSMMEDGAAETAGTAEPTQQGRNRVAIEQDTASPPLLFRSSRTPGGTCQPILAD